MADKQDKVEVAVKKDDENSRISNAIDSQLSDSYNYSSSELYEQLGEAWRRYFRQPYENEVAEFSQWVSPMIQQHVNDTRAFITTSLTKNGADLIKFRPKSMDDLDAADNATTYINHHFRHVLDGAKIIDNCAFNAALLKICPVRVFMNEKKSSDEIEFKYDDKGYEEFQNKLAEFFVAYPELADVDPEYVKEENMASEEQDADKNVYACYRWTVEEVVDRYADVNVISPGNLFVSRQAESLEEAQLVAVMHQMTISELRTLYPDGPEQNGKKTKKEKEEFWTELADGYYSWYNEREWIEKWAYDSLGYYQEQESLESDDLGNGARKVFVVDAEIEIDLHDTGITQMYHVVKAGREILHMSPIVETSFVMGGLLPTGNRWLPIGLVDLILDEAKEETINTRAFTDATVQSAHSNYLIDPDQVDMSDVENSGPDDIWRRLPNSGKNGVPAIEQVKRNGPDPSVLQAISHFNQIAGNSTGVGASFAGASMDDLSDMRLDKESVAAIDNKSSLLLNYMAHNFADFVGQLMTKLLNVAIRGNASPAVIQVADKWHEIDPIMLRTRSEYVVTADVGVNAEQDKLKQQAALMTFFSAASGGGAPGPDGQPTPSIPVALTDTAGFEIAKQFFDAHNLPGFEKIVVNPNIPDGQEQVTSLLAQMQKQFPIMVQEGIAAALEQAKQQPEVMEAMAKARKLNVEADVLETGMEKEVMDMANKLDAEDRREDEAVGKEALGQAKLDQDNEQFNKTHSLAVRELDISERLSKETPEEQKTSSSSINT